MLAALADLKLSAELPIIPDNGRLKEDVMATPISGGTAFDFGAAAQATAAQPQTTTTATASVKQPTKIEPTGYTVKLSDDAQVRLLNAQGHSVSQISVITNLSTKAVDGYLRITQAPPPTVHASDK
jgi:hypothetical protein